MDTHRRGSTGEPQGGDTTCTVARLARATGRRATRHGGRKGCGRVCAPTMRERGGVGGHKKHCGGATGRRRRGGHGGGGGGGRIAGGGIRCALCDTLSAGLAVAQRDMRGRGACRIVSVLRIVYCPFVGYALVWGTRALVDAIMRGWGVLVSFRAHVQMRVPNCSLLLLLLFPYRVWCAVWVPVCCLLALARCVSRVLRCALSYR